MANTLMWLRKGAVGFIDWLGVIAFSLHCKKQKRCTGGCKNRIISGALGPSAKSIVNRHGKRILTMHVSNKNNPDLPASFSFTVKKSKAVLSINGKEINDEEFNWDI